MPGYSIGSPKTTKQQGKTLLERFCSVILITDSCWLWLGGKKNGYGQFKLCGKHVFAHRLSYEIHKGFIPNGLIIDHLCRRRDCVNPYHLEAVTAKENTLRGISPPANNAQKTHCQNGHELIRENLLSYEIKRGHRRCRLCFNAMRRANHDKEAINV